MLIAAWVNGVPQETVAMTERGFAYGDGHFTTLAVRQGQAWLRAELKRLGIAVTPRVS